MPDFKVLRGSSVIPNGQTSLTLTEGVDYTLESGSDNTNTFAYITSSRLTGMGRTAGGNSQNLDDVSAHISSTDITSGLTFTRTGASNNNRVTWEILQYIGPASGANEFIVRGIGTVGLTGFSNTASIAGVSNDADVVPFITGQSGANTGRNDYHTALHTSTYATGTATFTRGSNDASSTVSYAAVEWTGANWQIQTTEFSQSDGTASITAVDRTKTFLHVSYRYDNDSASAGLDDCGNIVRWQNDSTLQITNSTTSTDAAVKFNRVWIIENTQSGTGEMVVEESFNLDIAGSGEEEVGNITVSAVSSLDTASLMGITSNSTGGGTAHPRGIVVLNLTTTTNVNWRQSDNGQTSDLVFYVVQWPEAQGGAGQDDLTADDVVSGTPTVDTLSIGQTHSISADDVLSGTPVVDDSAIGQTHDLSAVEVTSGIPTIEDATLTAVAGVDNLTADDISATPVVDASAIGQIHDLLSDEVLSGVPTVEDSTAGIIVGQDNLDADDVLSGVPVVDVSTLGQTHDLLADEISATPVVDDATLSQIVALLADDVESGVPTVESATLTPVFGNDALEADEISVTPIVDAATIAQIHPFSTSDLESQVTVDDATINQSQALEADSVDSGVPIVEASNIGQVHVLSGEDVSTTPIVESPFIFIGDPPTEILEVAVRIQTDIDELVYIQKSIYTNVEVNRGVLASVSITDSVNESVNVSTEISELVQVIE